MALGTAHDILNYSVFKGIVSFSDDGTAWTDVGDCSEFTLSPTADFLDHYSHRSGIRVKDRSVLITASMQLKITFDEPVLDNLKIALGGTDLSGGGMTIFGTTSQTKHVKLVGGNTIGVPYTVILYPVTFKPSGDISFISEDQWSTVQVTGEVLTPFGTIVQNA